MNTGRTDEGAEHGVDWLFYKNGIDSFQSSMELKRAGEKAVLSRSQRSGDNTPLNLLVWPDNDGRLSCMALFNKRGEERQLSARDPASIFPPDAPDLPSLTFRPGRGEGDCAAIYAIHVGSRKADQTDLHSTFEPYHGLITTVEDVAAAFRWCDPASDVLIAEVDGEVVGYARAGHPFTEYDGTRSYWVDTLVLPQWRGHGIEDALLRWLEGRFRAIETSHPPGQVVYTAAASSLAHGPRGLLERFGYPLFINHDDLALTDFGRVPDTCLPEGIELRPVSRADFRAAWDATVAVLLEIHPRYGFGSEAEYEQRINSPGLGQGITWAAWQGHEIVATALCEIARGRGAVEQFAVLKGWRRRGIGKALLIQALRSLQKQGISTVRVHTPTDNAYGARTLYESVGFHLVKQQGFYRKQVR
jgi:mycothiol synthase